MEKKSFALAEIGKYLVLACVAVGYMAVCSISTTPLLQYVHGQDASFFTLVGQGMLAGKLPYRDFFDMKGPYLFLMEYLGQRIAYGRLGTFILQCILFFLDLVFANLILNQFHPSGRIPTLYALILLLPAAYVMSYTMTGGNLTEELSLPLLMASLYFCLRHLKLSEIPSPENQEHPLKIGIFYGLVFGVMCMLRITNAALVGAILLTISLNLILWGKWENLLLNGLCFILGAGLAFVPACVWAAYHGILGEMLYQVFFFGGSYSGEVGFLEKLRGVTEYIWPCFLAPLSPFVVLAVYRVKNWKYWLLSAGAYVLLAVAVIMGNLYCHYFVLSIPNLVLAAAFFVRYHGSSPMTPGKKRARAVITGILVLALLAAAGKIFYERAFLEIRYAMYCARYHCEDTAEYDAVQDILSRIPEEEQSDIFVYGMGSCSSWYLLAGQFPPNKYCDWQVHYIELVPEIGDSLEQWLGNKGVKWIVLESGQQAEPERIREAMDANYEQAYANSWYRLLKAKG